MHDILDFIYIDIFLNYNIIDFINYKGILLIFIILLLYYYYININIINIKNISYLPSMD